MQHVLKRVVQSFLVVNSTGFLLTAFSLLVAELAVCLFVVNRVPYTEIDWSTYMQQVKYALKGEKNYTRISGDTGPIVYPAGHLVAYRLLHSLTSAGSNIRRAQYIFVGLYLLNLLLVFRLYYKSRRIAPFVLVLVCLTSYRVHSIFILRLFNDPIAMLLFYAAVNLWISQQWLWGCILYSVAVSVKMNVLLFAPAVFFILLISNRTESTAYLLAVCALVQVVVGSEYLYHDPISYLKMAFQLNRVFLFKWTVNWRFLPEWLFLDNRFHLALLALHVAALALFAHHNWFKSQGGLITRLRSGIRTRLDCHEVMYALFTANLVGMSFARSLHYQFYCWYYHSLAYLLFATMSPPKATETGDSSALNITPSFLWNVAFRVVILLGVEYCWNVYPSTKLSSALLHLLHASILFLSIRGRGLQTPSTHKRKTT